MKDRLEKLMKAEGLSPARFADEIGVQRSSISHILSGRNKPSYDFITKILDRFQGINAEWLLTGKGSMIKGQDPLKAGKTEQENLLEFSREKETVNTYRHQDEGSKEIQYKETIENEKEKRNTFINETDSKHKFTNVNNVDYILVFYKDGSFRQYNARD